MRRLLALALALLAPWPLSAQNAITQEGTTLQNAPMMFRGNNRARQGATVNGAPTGQTVTTGDSVVGGRCDYSAPTDDPKGYYRLCLDASTGTIKLDGTRLPPLGTIKVEINGTIVEFPASAAIAGSDAVAGSNAALKAVTGATGKRMVRLGFTTPGDGGLANYNWATANCTAADDGAQIQPTATGCWVADFSGTVPSVKVWGALCDGMTNDGPAINAAIATASRLDFPAGATCRIATTVTLTKFPIKLSGLQSWPPEVPGISLGKPATIKCDTGPADCIITPLNDIQKGGIEISDLVFDGSGQTAGNILRLNDTTKSTFRNLVMNNVWNGVFVYGPNDNTNAFDGLQIQGCRGDQGVLWYNDKMANNSNVLTLNNGVIACGSPADGIVLDGNVQTLRMNGFAIIDSGKGLWMRNQAGSTVCPGYVFLNDVEFNGGSHQENFIKADCGYSVQIVNAWSYGATSGDGFAFSKHTAPATTGSNVLQISNSNLLGNMIGGRCIFLDWNHISISNTMLSGCTGNVLESGANSQRTIVSGGLVGGPSSGYCVASTAAGPARSLFLSGTMVFGGCTLGNFNDPGQAIVLTGVVGGPPLKAMTSITGCGTGCTAAIFNGNQSVGSILVVPGAGSASDGSFVINFTVPLTPFPVCIAMPRQGGTGSWNNLATILMDPSGDGSSTKLYWHNNAVPLTSGGNYYIDFRCTGLTT